MKSVIQRVRWARVTVDSEVVGEIGPGVLTLLGVAKGDTEEQLQKTINKILGLRIFEDDDGKMNRSLQDVEGGHLIVSQFTLLGDCQRGKRPSFIHAEQPNQAKVMYEKAIQISKNAGVTTASGTFQAHMQVELENDGPVTFVLEF